MSSGDLLFPHEEEIARDYDLRAKRHLQTIAGELVSEASAFRHSDLTVSKFVLAVGAATLTLDAHPANHYDMVANNAINAANGGVAVSQELPDMALWSNFKWRREIAETFARIKFKDEALKLPYEHEVSVYLVALDALANNLAELVPANDASA